MGFRAVREHHTQVPLTEDQYAVGEFGSDRAYEPFGETVRPRTTRRNLDYADADVSEEGIEGRCELTDPISDEEPKDVPPLGKGLRTRRATAAHARSRRAS